MTNRDCLRDHQARHSPDFIGFKGPKKIPFDKGPVFWYEFVYINDLPGNSLNEGVTIVAEEGLERKDLEELLAVFENRQDEKTKAREQRQDEKSIAFEKRKDEKFVAFEKRQDEELKATEDRGINQFHIIPEGLVDQIVTV